MRRLSIPFPKPPKLPKLHKLSIRKVGNGTLFTHHFGGQTKQFGFRNPQKAMQHLRRTLANEWQHPNVGKEASAIDRELNI